MHGFTVRRVHGSSCSGSSCSGSSCSGSSCSGSSCGESRPEQVQVHGSRTRRTAPTCSIVTRAGHDEPPPPISSSESRPPKAKAMRLGADHRIAPRTGLDG
ncbi:hypothetical protein FEF34_01880 [Streptomyces marianii]|uniref:Uncharacterized protein n=1 Tax=Streptomyces marianii TaxID=1817406 RepID=A0A5R9DZG3_9ACTN|nr:hypothetical protein FEF34_01880 [Streptomyces marianii]